MMTKLDFYSIIESSSRLASLFATHLANDDLAPLINYESEIENMKASDIQKVAKEFLDIDNSTTVILKDVN